MVFGVLRGNEKGTVMIAVLIIAVAVAIVSYGLLINSLNAIERSDVQDYRVKAKALAEGGLDEAAFSLKQDTNYIGLPENPGILPGWAGGGTDTNIKEALISNDRTWLESIDDLPGQSYHAAFSEYELSSYDTPDLYFVWGDTEQATYEFIDEETYKRHFFDYHYNPYQQETDIVLGASGEVNDNTNDRVFSFASRSYPSNITRYQTRTNSAWEQNENDPEPAYFESKHSAYKADTGARYWTVTYDYDPTHPGRNITAIDLLAKPGDLAIGSPGDTVWATGWNGTTWDPPMAIPPNYRQGPYTNPTNLLTDGIESTSIRIGMMADDIPDPLGLDYGFRVNGIKYYFNYDRYPARYETPHPYDQLPASLPGTPGIQVVYSPYQIAPGVPGVVQRMRVTFDWKFFLEDGDTLTLMNLAGNPPYVVDSLTGNAGAGKSYEIDRQDPNVPLAMGLLFDNDGDNFSSTNNYGYLVEKLEYVNEFGKWVTVTEPNIETPHLGSLGSFLPPSGFPDYAMYNYIYRPNVPGGGALTDWKVHFDEGCDLYAAVNTDEDYIRITTPGFDPYGGASDTHYFVNPYGSYGGFIGLPNYHDVAELKAQNYECGLSPFMEIYCHIDDQDDYANVAQNWGFRADWITLTADGASDIAPYAPTVAATVSSPPDKGYLNFGSGIDSRGEWWITDKKLDGSVVEMLGIHFDLSTFDLDPGDYIAIYDEEGNEVGTLTYRSFRPEGPDGSPPKSEDVEGSGPQDEDPHGTGPENAPGWDEGSINLNDTRGWVLVPGESAHIVLVGDGDDNKEHLGFWIDRTAWFSGEVNYSALGSFERLDEAKKDSAEYSISGKSEYLEIR